jgi:hypothetical protein
VCEAKVGCGEGKMDRLSPFVIGAGALGTNEPSENGRSTIFNHRITGSGRNRKFYGVFDLKTSFLDSAPAACEQWAHNKIPCFFPGRSGKCVLKDRQDR